MHDVASRDREPDSTSDRKTANAPTDEPDTRRQRSTRLFGLGAFVLLAAGLAFGASRSYSQQREVMATAEQIRDFVPSVRVATVRASDATVLVTLPATTSAFVVANMYARASGYIDKRYVDIGDRVKEGQLLAEIVASELDHQIAQAEATLGQLRAAVEQAHANKNLAQVTWDRDKGLVEKGWVTPQQGDIDRFTLNAREAALSVAQANVAAQQAQLKVLYQQKAYQRVVAPFDGVVTQRNIDVGDLVHADTTTGTFKLKSEFQNEKNALWPGQFVNVRVKVSTVDKGLVVPATAVQRGPDGSYAYVVQPDSTVKMTPLKVGDEAGDSTILITSGLALGDKVVTEGQFRLKPGSKVEALAPGQAAPATSAAELDKLKQQNPNQQQQRGGRRRGGGGGG